MSDAIRIFSHSITMVFRDFGATLRATSAGLGVIAMSLALLLFAAPDEFGTFLAPTVSPDALAETPNIGVIALGFIFMFVGSLMMIAAWHRYVLLPKDQRGEGFTPSLGMVLGYLGRSLLLGMTIGILAIPLMFLVGIAVSATGSGVVGSLVGVLITAILGWMLFRLSLILPACTIGHQLSFSESWHATKPLAGTIFGLMVLLTMADFVINFIFGIVLTHGVIGGLISFVLSLLYALISASILTTLYGIAIEKRAL